jgi:hypothetical protein
MLTSSRKVSNFTGFPKPPSIGFPSHKGAKKDLILKLHRSCRKLFSSLLRSVRRYPGGLRKLCYSSYLAVEKLLHTTVSEFRKIYEN